MVHSLIDLVHVVLQECILLLFSSYFYIQIFFIGDMVLCYCGVDWQVNNL